jgi:diguanylate cyclase (GGDEF)-like protein
VRKRAVLAIALAWAVGLCLPSSALDPAKLIVQYGHHVWRERDGLPQNSIQAMVQSDRGYLWLGTQEGLVRFDGVRFTIYDQDRAPILSGSNVVALCKDPGGGVWVCLDSGGLYKMSGGDISIPERVRPLQGYRFMSVMEDKERRLWLGTDNRGLVLLDGSSVRTYTTSDGLPGNVVYATYEAPGGTVWIGTNHGLARWTAGRLSAFPVPVKKRNWYYALAGDGRGGVWVGSFRGLLHIFLDDSVKLYTTKEGLPHDMVNALLDLPKENSLWIGTKNGLCRYRQGRFESYGPQEGLSNGQVLSILEDREGNLWVGTADGLNRFRDDKFFSLTKANGLLNDLVLNVLQAKDGSLWMGTDGGGASRWSQAGVTNLTKAQGLPSDTVDTLMEDSDGSILLALDAGGIVRWRDGRLTRLLPKDRLLANTGFTCMLRDRAGTLWVGCANGVFRIRDGHAGLLEKKDGLSGQSVDCLLEDRGGGIWMGTDTGGLDFYKDGRFTAYTTRQGLASDSVLSLYQDKDGTLWIGTTEGLSRLRNGRFANITRRQGLFNNTIFVILDDGAGRLWMSCNKGVFSALKSQLDAVADGRAAELHCDAYGRSDGMGSSECNGGLQPAGCRTLGGWLCFPTVRGLAVLNPKEIRLNRQPPPVVIEGMKVDGRSVPLKSGLQLTPGRHRVEFLYTALSLVAPEKERFRYRLIGYDRDWIRAGTHREAVYTGLPPGRYVFQVIACNNDGFWNEKGDTFAFVHLPYFYQTWWFVLLCLLVAGAVVYGAVTLRLKAAARREAALTLLVEERTSQLAKVNEALLERGRQLESANAQLQELSNRDDLTGVANRRRFGEILDAEWRRAARTNAPLALLMADIDHFKPYNDAYGHQTGDLCLKRAAEAMAGSLQRAGDLLARYGGEEFVVILPAHDLAEAAEVAERLRARVEALAIPTEVSDVSPYVTISIGVAVAEAGKLARPEELVAAADAALYRAKREGRNRVRLAERG